MRKADAFRLPLLPVFSFIAASALCLGTGYLTGKLWTESHRNRNTGIDSNAGAAKLGGRRPAPGQPVYAPGSTRYQGEAGSPQPPLCLNTCKKAKNGVCDDGRFNSTAPMQVFCDLGTDCDDCGPWTPSVDVPWASGVLPGPVQRLVDQGILVRVRRTVTTPAFLFAYTDPKQDYDVSFHMENNGGVEMGITKVFYKIFQNGCQPKGPKTKRGLFVDVGANFGWFSVLAAVMGCRVVAFEPVPHFHAFFEYSVHLNPGLARLVDMRGNVVSHESGKTMTMVVPNKGIWGTAGIGGLNIDPAIQGNQNLELSIPSQTLDTLIKEDVLLLKVDVEGWEWSVMQGAAQLLENFDVRNVVMEYSPGVPERHYFIPEIKATIQMLINFCMSAYKIAHLDNLHKHENSQDQQLGPFQEIKRHNLLYDLLDAHLFGKEMLGCPIDPELMQTVSAWSRCMALPEDPNPRSFRSILGHNTNLWASKDIPMLNLQGIVGIIPLDAPYTQYFVPEGTEYGMGTRRCKDLPLEVQVRHRCHCTNTTVCGAEQQRVEALSRQGLIGSNYVLDTDGRMLEGYGDAKKMMEGIRSAALLGESYGPGMVSGPLTTGYKPLVQHENDSGRAEREAQRLAQNSKRPA